MQTVKEIRAAKPKQIRWALALSITALVLWLPIAGATMPETSAVSLFILLYLSGLIGSWRGRKAARTLATVSTGFLYLFLLPYIWLGAAEPLASRGGTGYAVIDLIAVLAAGATLVLWYSPAGLTYFDRISAARAAERSTQAGS